MMKSWQMFVLNRRMHGIWLNSKNMQHQIPPSEVTFVFIIVKNTFAPIEWNAFSPLEIVNTLLDVR